MKYLSIILSYIILKPPKSTKLGKNNKFDNIKPNFNTLRKILKLNILYEPHDNRQKHVAISFSFDMFDFTLYVKFCPNMAIII